MKNIIIVVMVIFFSSCNKLSDYEKERSLIKKDWYGFNNILFDSLRIDHIKFYNNGVEFIGLDTFNQQYFVWDIDESEKILISYYDSQLVDEKDNYLNLDFNQLAFNNEYTYLDHDSVRLLTIHNFNGVTLNYFDTIP